MELTKTLAEMQRAVLAHDGLGLTEIRSKVAWGKPEFVFDSTTFDSKTRGAKDVYVGINPRSTDKGTGKNGGITPKEVSYLTCLILDIDPVRGRDEPSSDAQHQQAIEIGRQIVADFPGALAVSSGSGCHVYFPIEPLKVLNVKGLTKSVQTWTKTMRDRYATPTQKIDHIFNLDRVIRVWGSHNARSDRPCEPITPVTDYRFRLPLSQAEESPKDQTQESPTETEGRFERLLLTNSALRAIVQGKADFGGDRSKADWAFINHLAQAHFTDDEIKGLMAKNPLGRGGERLDDVERVLAKLRENQEITTFSLVHHADKYKRNLDSRKMGLRTGFKTFDEMVSGLKNQKVYLFAARPTNGKTTLMMQIMDQLVSVEKQVGLVYPTEVGAEPCIDKLVSRRAGVNLKRFQNGTFQGDDREKIAKAFDEIKHLPLIIAEDFGLTTEKIEAKMREVAPSVVAIDYLNALKYDKGGEPSEIAKAMRKIKELAGDYNVPILLFAQLRRGDGQLDLSSIKGSGAIEELSDVIAFLYGVGDKFDYPTRSVLDVMKSKYSDTGPIDLRFWRSVCKFEEAN